jgi:hypothetical protein
MMELVVHAHLTQTAMDVLSMVATVFIVLVLAPILKTTATISSRNL